MPREIVTTDPICQKDGHGDGDGTQLRGNVSSARVDH